MGDSAGSTDGQQSAAQEQSAMQDKINNFVDNGGTGDAAAAAGQSGGSDATGSGPTMPSGGDMGGSSGAGMSGGSGADMGGQQPDVSTPPAPEPTQPPADTGAQGSS
jgi:hypothetical protein